MRPAFRAVIIGFLALLMAACASGPITSVWMEPGVTPSRYRDLVIFAIATSPGVRRACEDNFVTAIGATGVRARPGHALVPDAHLGRAARVRQAAADAGADGIVILHLIAEERAETTALARLASVPESSRRILPYYGRVYDEVSRPGYYADYEVLRLEANLYDTQSERLVWSGRSLPLDPRSEQTRISQVIADVVAQMRTDAVLP